MFISKSVSSVSSGRFSPGHGTDAQPVRKNGARNSFSMNQTLALQVGSIDRNQQGSINHE
jgi:hypothetical protein